MLLEALLDRIEALLADIAYAARARLLDRLEQHQVEAVIPPKSNQKEPLGVRPRQVPLAAPD